jgi:hypothetical protein
MDAHYHLNAAIGKRTNRGLLIGGCENEDEVRGQSATAKVDYVIRQGRFRDKREEVVFATCGNMPGFASRGSPKRAQVGYAYWMACDAEERANGVLFISIEYALPDSLSEKERTALAVRYANALANTSSDIGHPMPWTMVIHRKADENGVLHDHAHLVLSPRCNDGVERSAATWFRRANRKHPEYGGARKTRSFQPKKWLVGVRQLWQKVGNAALMRAACLETLDCRSYEARGLKRVPGIHLGPAVAAFGRRGISSRRLEELKRIERENEERERLAKALEANKAEQRRIKEEEELVMLFEAFANALVEPPQSEQDVAAEFPLAVPKPTSAPMPMAHSPAPPRPAAASMIVSADASTGPNQWREYCDQLHQHALRNTSARRSAENSAASSTSEPRSATHEPANQSEVNDPPSSGRITKAPKR